MKVTWTRRWTIAWLVWLAVSGLSFLALEVIGLYCEWLQVQGCSTLSSWMVSNWGVVFMVAATLVVASIACWHWWTVGRAQNTEQEKSKEHRAQNTEEKWRRRTMGERVSDACPWVEVERYDGSTGGAGSGGYWNLVDFWYIPPTKVGSGPANIYWLAYHADGTPAWDARAHLLNGGDALLSFKENSAHQAEANAGMTRDGVFYPDRGQRGPYSARMDGTSDVLTGMGLPMAGHAQYWGVWKWVEANAPPVVPPTQPPTSDYITRSELAQALAAVGAALIDAGSAVLAVSDKGTGRHGDKETMRK